MIQKKGQAAMEFLMTYGWALLVVLIAIGALAFFGVLNPSKFLPNSCTVAPGFACTDFAASATTQSIIVILQNGLGENLNSVKMSLSNSNVAGCDAGGGAFTPAWVIVGPYTSLNDGAATTFTRSCTSGLAKGSKFKGDLQVDYQIGTTSLAHKKVGQLVVGIEA